MHSQNKESAVWVETSRPPSMPSVLGLRAASMGSPIPQPTPPGDFNLYYFTFSLLLSFLANNNGIIIFTLEIFFLPLSFCK